MSKMEEILLQQNGPLLGFQSLAKNLDRSPEGLRISLRTESEWSKSINSTRLKIGRRVYFRTAEIAQILNAAGRD